MIGTFLPAGRCRGVFSLAGELNRQGYQVSLCCLDTPPGIPEQFGRYFRVPVIAGLRFEELAWSLKHKSYDLIHLQGPHLLNRGAYLASALGIPFGVTVPVHPADPQDRLLKQAVFVIATRTEIRDALEPHYSGTVVITEGIDLSKFCPAPKTGFRLVLSYENGVTEKAALALIKAAALCETPLDILGSEKFPPGAGIYHGRPPCPASMLAPSQVVAGCGHAILEGMACGNAILQLGRRYRGLLTPDRLHIPARSANNSEEDEPCYRNIFGDLARLFKDRDLLQQLQDRGRRYVRENHDLRLVAERTAQLYALTAK